MWMPPCCILFCWQCGCHLLCLQFECHVPCCILFP
jgi:hypothetical protein